MPVGSYEQVLVDYVFNIAKVFDIRYGPMHAEVFLTKSGPVLIEAAARIMGANIPYKLMQECLTHSQLYMSILAYGMPTKFLSEINPKPVVNKNLLIVFLISNISGTLIKINYLDQIKELESFYDIKIRLEDMVYKTIDYDTSPGLVYLCHKDENILKNDYLTIRTLELSNMYEVQVKT